MEDHRKGQQSVEVCENICENIWKGHNVIKNRYDYKFQNFLITFYKQFNPIDLLKRC